MSIDSGRDSMWNGSMVRAFLRSILLAVVTATAGCLGPGVGDPGHPELACASCHNGGLADAGPASVPGKTCTSSTCHSDGGPAEVVLGGVHLTHELHGASGRLELSCAGCHTHSQGGEPLVVSEDGCALCHAIEIDGRREQDCRECHTRPEQVAVSSQGLALPHDRAPLIESPCTRCHYDVAVPPTAVSGQRCDRCHADADPIAGFRRVDEAHALHEGLGCTSCHEKGVHRIVAMSSAVWMR